MKIAFFHELHKGGARRGTNEFAAQLKKQGHIVDLFTIDDEILEEKKFYNKIRVYRFSSVIWKGHDWKKRLYKDTIELIKLALLDRKIARRIVQEEYDLVYIAASRYIESPFILQFLKKIPSFFYCNDPYYRIIYESALFHKENINFFKLQYEYLNRFIRKYLDKWNISKATYIIAISKFSNEQFKKTYGRKGKIIYYGVDTGFFFPKKIKKDIDILFIGSYDFLDGYPFFKEVVKKMKRKSKIRSILFEKEWLSDRELRDVYRRTKILVAPAFREPLGLVPLEAMACGAVVVAVNEGAHLETVLDNKTGLILKRDASLFGSKINWLLNNNKILDTMSINASKFVAENWGWEKRGRELEKFLMEKII